MGWTELRRAAAGCTACALCAGRRNTVFGAGDEQAHWMVVGEVPDEMADLRGQPFMGPAGDLLDNMLRAVGAGRQKGAFVTNALKCRPPANRNPEPGEAALCEAYLRRQVALVRPRVILAMGPLATRTMLGSDAPIGKLRGTVHAYRGTPVVATYHPGHLMRSPASKAQAWLDLCLARTVVRDAIAGGADQGAQAPR
jgi:DNA polymerase